MGKTRDLFKKIRYQGNISCKDGHNQGQKWYGPTEAEDIKKRWQEYTEELYKKDLHNLDNHDGVIIMPLEPDILECKVKRAQEASLRTKQVEVMEFLLSYFKSSKTMLLKCCIQYARKFGKLSSGHRTGKGQFSFQSHRRAMRKNAETTAQLHSSHMLEK